MLMTIMNEMKRTGTHNEQALKAPNRRSTEFRERKKNRGRMAKSRSTCSTHSVDIITCDCKNVVVLSLSTLERLMKLWPLTSAQKSVDSRPEKGNFVID